MPKRKDGRRRRKSTVSPTVGKPGRAIPGGLVDAVLSKDESPIRLTDLTPDPAKRILTESIVLTKKGLLPFLANLMQQGNAIAEKSFKAGRRSRNNPPRNTDRDREIVRLYDDEGKTFGQIAQTLGKKRDTVERAYHRQKKRMS